MISSNTDNLFLSDAALAANDRREEKMKSGLGAAAGNAYKPAPNSKLLCMLLSPRASRDAGPGLGPAEDLVVYLGESSHIARAVDLKSRTNTKVFKGHTGPVTCLAVEPGPDGQDAYLYTGAWDKTIKKWDIKTTTCVATFAAHTDFIKSIILIPPAIVSLLSTSSSEAVASAPATPSNPPLPKPAPTLLVSSSSDRTIRIWNTATGKSEKTLKGHPRGVECLALLFSDPTQTKVLSATLMSGGSEGFIHGWDLGMALASTRSVLEAEEDRLKLENGHETSVYGLAVSEGVFWSVSADKSARRWDSDNAFKQDLRLEHPDFVRSIAVNPATGMVFTGCRDEEIRCWDSTNGQLVAEISGHYGEITSLIVPPSAPSTLLSSSLDGTVRTWDISPEGLKEHAKLWQDKLAEAEAKKKEEERKKVAGMLTEEEERELAELMEDDE